MRILSLGTYPIQLPIHGGQRRVAALCRQLRNTGHHVTYVSAFPEGAYASSVTGPLDYSVPAIADQLGGGWASDVAAGEYCASNDTAYAHFMSIADAIRPDVIMLESPFLFPLALKLNNDLGAKAALVYSSHNVEAPLKHDVLRAAGVAPQTIAKIVAKVDDTERKLVAASSLILAVSKSDAATYTSWNKSTSVAVYPNGVDRPQRADVQRPDTLPNPYVSFVGSAHIPNRDGFINLILGDGLQFLPPEKSMAVVGGVSELIYNHGAFQKRVTSNCDRVQFYPNVSDRDLSEILGHSAGILLPIETGGGTNLKTAEALISGKWVVGTEQAFRGYEGFMKDPSVIIARSRGDFVAAIRKVLKDPAPDLQLIHIQKRQEVLWDNILADLSFEKYL